MGIVARCGGCKGRFTLDDKWAGKRAKCARCGTVIQIPAAVAVPVGAERDILDLADEPDSPPPSRQPNDPFPVALHLAPSQRAAARRTADTGDVITDPTRSFWADAAHSFVVPFKGRGPFVLFFLLVFQACYVVVSFTPGILGLMSQFIILGWLCSVYLNIIAETCRGEDELPAIALTDGIWEDIVQPFFRCVGSFLWVGAPALITWLLVYLVSEEELQLNQLMPVLGLALLAVLIWPMTILTIALHGFTINALRYDLQVVSIMRALAPYAAICAMLLGTLGLGCGASVGLEEIGLVSLGFTGTLVAMLVQCYLMLISMRLIGLFYRHYKAKFAWQAE